jgi:hypothetical protein
MKLSIVTEVVIAKIRGMTSKPEVPADIAKMYAKSKRDCKAAAKSKKSGRTKK